MAGRALELSEAGEQRLAGHLAEWAAQAAPNDPSVRDTRAEVYRRRRAVEQSLMARGIYNDAAHP